MKWKIVAVLALIAAFWTGVAAAFLYVGWPLVGR
jgi:hypothetical protein